MLSVSIRQHLMAHNMHPLATKRKCSHRMTYDYLSTGEWGGVEAKNVLKVIFEAKSVPLLLNNAPRVKRLNLLRIIWYKSRNKLIKLNYFMLRFTSMKFHGIWVLDIRWILKVFHLTNDAVNPTWDVWFTFQVASCKYFHQNSVLFTDGLSDRVATFSTCTFGHVRTPGQNFEDSVSFHECQTAMLHI